MLVVPDLLVHSLSAKAVVESVRFLHCGESTEGRVPQRRVSVKDLSGCGL